MRAAIHNPYLDTLGGGERYTLSFCLALVAKGYNVDLEWNNRNILGLLENRFGMNLDMINVIPDVKRGDGYDLCFWVSDGSIPALKSRKNFLHFQVPFRGVNGRSLINKMKLFRINKIICNSNFTKKVIDTEFGVNSVVIYPPVSVEDIKPKHKENIILNVSRFSELLQSKHQDILIETFKKLFDSGYKEWKLILAGGSEIGGEDNTGKLNTLSEGYPVQIIKNPNYKTIVGLYGKTKIFWSASGFGTDTDKDPQKAEHFGISVAEAMAGGAIPVVYNGGGHKEIITDKNNGFLWNKETELLKFTQQIIDNKTLLIELSKSALNSSKTFSNKVFKEKIYELI